MLCVMPQNFTSRATLVVPTFARLRPMPACVFQAAHFTYHGLDKFGLGAHGVPGEEDAGKECDAVSGETEQAREFHRISPRFPALRQGSK